MARGGGRRWRVGIAVQVDVLVVLVVFAMGGALGSYFLHAQRREMEADLGARIRLVGSYLAAAAERPWNQGDAAGVDALLRGFIVDPEISYLVLKTSDGDVRAARWMAETRGAVSEYSFPIHAFGVDATGPAVPFGVTHPADAKVIGTVAIGVDLAPLAAQWRALLWRTTAALALGGVVATAIGHLLVVLLLRGNMARLLAGIRAFGAGDLAHRMRLDVRTAEFAEMGRAFDDMANRLSATLVTTAALEGTVAARTEELTQALEDGLRAQRALAEREEHVRLLLDSTAEAIYGIDRSGRCTFANPACARLLGYASAAELLGRDMHELAHHSLADGTPLSARDCRIFRAFRDGREYHSEEELLWRRDGQPFPVECWSHPVQRDGRLIGAVVTFLDVTERRRMEGELLKMKKLESLGVLAGGIAHDFNNMLTGILGNLSLAREQGGHDADTRELLDEAEQAAKRARALTQQLLTFSRGGAPVKKVVSLRAVVDDAATFALRGSTVRGHFVYDERLWSVEADPGQLAQVIQNLVINGVQAMPQGGAIAISCDNVAVGPASGVPLPPGRYVRVTVRDEGTGIPPEHLQRIFDPYFTTKQTGSGLGLATVYAILKKHGGHVAVASQLGRGTTFELHLPATSRSVAAEVVRAAPVGGRGRVLVMDDEALVRNAAGGMLASLGYDVVSASDGAEALAVFEQARRDGRAVSVVLVDLTVPGGMGGLEAVRRLRALDPGVRVVATSGYSNDPIMAAHGDYGFVGVLPKPYTLEDLSRAISEAVAARA